MTPPNDLRALRRRLAQTMAADFPRLRPALDRWRADAPGAEEQLAKLAQQIEASASKRDARAAWMP